MSRRERHIKKISSKKKILIGTLITLVVIIGVLFAGGYMTIHNILNKMDKVEINKEEPSINPEIKEKYGDIKNIALFGIDSEDGIAGRSDSIMILTLDTTNEKVKLTSIMRDSYVNISGYEMDKINHAYAFGGPELAMKTLNQNFNLDITDFFAVNFSTLPTIIDKVGGVEIDIIDEEIPYISGVNSTGTQLLSGEQALAYARIRYATGGDYKRTERQRTVIDALFNKLKTIEISKYPQLITDCLPLVKTNMSSGDIIGLSKDFASLMNSTLEQERFPRDGYCEGQTIEGIYYLTFDNEVAIEQMHRWIFEDKR